LLENLAVILMAKSRESSVQGAPELRFSQSQNQVRPDVQTSSSEEIIFSKEESAMALNVPVVRNIGASSWGTFDASERQLVFIEKKMPECSPAFEIRECLPRSTRGAVLVEFFGHKAFSSACAWARDYTARNRGRARNSKISSSESFEQN
jgi:hypothetical protein